MLPGDSADWREPGQRGAQPQRGVPIDFLKRILGSITSDLRFQEHGKEYARKEFIE